MTPTAAPTTMEDINELLKSLNDPRANNEPVLGVNVLAMQAAKNNGFPLHMYHQKLDPIIVLNRAQEQAVSQRGYVRHYINHDYPKFKFRRNVDPKFEKADPVKGKVGDFIEERVVRDPKHEQELLKARTPQGCGPWFDRITDIEPIPDGPDEDPAVTIARLEGQLSEIRSKSPKA